MFCTPIGGGRISIAVLGEEALIRSLRDPHQLRGYLGRMHAGVMATLLVDGTPASIPGILPHRGQRSRHLCRDRLLLGGDAAVFLDPVSGAGMTLAAQSAEVLATAVAAAIHGTVDPRTAQVRAERELRRLARPFAHMTQVLRLLGRVRIARRIVIPVLRRSPWLLAAGTSRL